MVFTQRTIHHKLEPLHFVTMCFEETVYWSHLSIGSVNPYKGIANTMSRKANILRVLVSSPSDVNEERMRLESIGNPPLK
jgi:hypothetical protein